MGSEGLTEKLEVGRR